MSNRPPLWEYAQHFVIAFSLFVGFMTGGIAGDVGNGAWRVGLVILGIGLVVSGVRLLRRSVIEEP